MTKKYNPIALKATSVADLRKVAKGIFDAEDIKGLTKAQLVTLLTDLEKEPIHTLESHEAEMPNCDDPDCEFHYPEVIETAPFPYDQPAIDAATEMDNTDDDELDDDDDEDDITLEEVAQAVEKAQGKKAAVDRETYTAKQIATRIGTDAKTLRKFFRATDMAVGQGGRYDFPASELPKIDKAFKAWTAKKPGRPTKSAAPKVIATRMATPVDEEDDEELELDLDDELEDDEIDDLEDDTARLEREAELLKKSPFTLRKIAEPLGVDHRLRKVAMIAAILDEEFNNTDDDEED